MANTKTGLGNDPLSWIHTTDTNRQESQRTNDKMVAENKDRQSNLIDGKRVRVVPIGSVFADPKQPRKEIDRDSPDMQELAESIRKHGFINFITVRETGPKQYIIIAGGRRFTAAQIAGLKEIPVMVVADDKEPVDYALLQLEENLKRKDLTAFEEAEAYTRLQLDFGLQQKDVVEKTGKSKSYISKMLKLNNLAAAIKADIQESLQKVPREVMFELADYGADDQQMLWGKIRDNATIVALGKAVKRWESMKKKGPGAEKNWPDPELVLEALKKAMKKDKYAIFLFLTPKKVEKLLKEFGE